MDSSALPALVADYGGTYAYLTVTFFTFYGRHPIAPAVARFVAFVVVEVAVSSVASALMSAAILATIFRPQPRLATAASRTRRVSVVLPSRGQTGIVAIPLRTG